MTRRTRFAVLVSTLFLLDFSVDGFQGALRRTRQHSPRRRINQQEASSSSVVNPAAYPNGTVDLLAKRLPAELLRSSSLETQTLGDFDFAAASDSARNLCFGGVGRLYSSHAVVSPGTSPRSAPDVVLDRLKRATVVVVGVGGVGSWAAEALGRSGVGSIVLVDLDDVCRSNINRQLHALHSTVGKLKVDVLRDRLIDINPDCNVTCIRDFVSSDNIHSIFDSIQPPSGGSSIDDIDNPRKRRQKHDMVVLDAMDGGADKAALVAACVARKISLVVCGGAAGRTDPTSVTVSDLTRVQDDRLLQSLRRNLRRHHNFPEGAPFRKKQPSPWKIPTVHSTQKEVSSSATSSPTSSLRRCDSDLGTACFVTGTFGFAAAGCVVDMIARDKYKIPYVRR